MQSDDEQRKTSLQKKKKRLFIGTFLPDADMQRLGKLHDYDTRLSENWDCRLRWVHPEKTHLTWVFLGDVEDSSIEWIKNALDNTLRGQPKLEVTYSKTDFWTSRGRANAFVLIPDTVPPALADLQSKIDVALKNRFQKREHSYKPHITVLRFASEPRKPLTIPEWFPIDSLLPLKHGIGEISLIHSHANGKGDYQRLFTWKLT